MANELKGVPEGMRDLVEILRENDVQFGVLSYWGYSLRWIADGSIKPELLRMFKESYGEITSIYERIRWEVQTEETGVGILRRAKGILDEMSSLVKGIFIEAETHLGVPTTVPERAFELIEELKKCVVEYRIPAYMMYREAQINYGGLSRPEWFEKGKPRIEQYDFSSVSREA